MTYPLQFRLRVLEIKKIEGLSYKQTADRFKVGIATLIRWSKEPEPKRGKKRPWLKVDMHRLAQDLRDFPDAFQHERAQRLGVKTRTIGDALKRMGVSRKKNSSPPQS